MSLSVTSKHSDDLYHDDMVESIAARTEQRRQRQRRLQRQVLRSSSSGTSVKSSRSSARSRGGDEVGSSMPVRRRSRRKSQRRVKIRGHLVLFLAAAPLSVGYFVFLRHLYSQREDGESESNNPKRSLRQWSNSQGEDDGEGDEMMGEQDTFDSKNQFLAALARERQLDHVVMDDVSGSGGMRHRQHSLYEEDLRGAKDEELLHDHRVEQAVVGDGGRDGYRDERGNIIEWDTEQEDDEIQPQVAGGMKQRPGRQVEDPQQDMLQRRRQQQQQQPQQQQPPMAEGGFLMNQGWNSQQQQQQPQQMPPPFQQQQQPLSNNPFLQQQQQMMPPGGLGNNNFMGGMQQQPQQPWAAQAQFPGMMQQQHHQQFVQQQQPMTFLQQPQPQQQWQYPNQWQQQQQQQQQQQAPPPQQPQGPPLLTSNPQADNRVHRLSSYGKEVKPHLSSSSQTIDASRFLRAKKTQQQTIPTAEEKPGKPGTQPPILQPKDTTSNREEASKSPALKTTSTRETDDGGVAAAEAAAVAAAKAKELIRRARDLSPPAKTKLPSLLEDNLSNLMDAFSSRSTDDVPLFWHVLKAGGTTVKDIYAKCMRLTEASATGAMDGHDQDKELKVITIKGLRYVNVDTTHSVGIKRAKKLGLIDTGLADIVFTSRLHEVADLFDPYQRGRLFTILRHPVERSVSLFHYLQVAKWEPTYNERFANMTLQEYANSVHAERDWMVRFLTNKETGRITHEDLNVAKQILKQKCLVGLTTEMKESVRRFNAYFGFEVKTERAMRCMRELLDRGGTNKHQHPLEKEGSPAWELLARNHRLDLELYDYALQLFEEQSTLFPEESAIF